MSPQQSPLRRQMIRELELHGKGKKTSQIYVAYVAELAKHYNQSPDLLSIKQLREFLHHLIVYRKLGRSAINVRVAAYRFFFEQVLRKPKLELRVPCKRIKTLPEALGHVSRCQRCEFVRYQYHSCRNRHCPGCQSQHTDLWHQARMSELLPVPYFHHVFTLPHKLNEWVLRSVRNYRAMIKLLFQSASQTLLEFGQDQFGGKIGITMVLHTWDQKLGAHFHVHALVTAGALCDGGTRWSAGGKNFLFPVKALSVVFRGKYLDGLKALIMAGELDIPESFDSISETLRQGSTGVLMKHLKPPWVVYAQRPFSGPEKLLGYLSRYVHRTAISNDRILGIDGDMVRFSYRDRADGDRRKTATIPGIEFLNRFLLHVLPQGLMRIRHYGFLANCIKQKSLVQCRKLLSVPSANTAPVQSLAQWFLELTGIDLTACPQCGGELEVTDLAPVRGAR